VIHHRYDRAQVADSGDHGQAKYCCPILPDVAMNGRHPYVASILVFCLHRCLYSARSLLIPLPFPLLLPSNGLIVSISGVRHDG
jgi:hypothetical protein